MAGAARVCPKCKAEYGTDVLFCPKDGSPLTNPRNQTQLTDEDPYLGLTIADQFRVEQLVGIGAMGRVYRAYQKGIERQVAIKVLHRELLRKPNVSARFQREAKVASRLMHPNVVQVLMIGELARSRLDVGGEGYLVMEYLDGISLRSALASANDALPLPRALHIALQVCDAVGEAHAQGVVHRDLKPENVMLVRRGDDPDFVKVLDFGVARIDWADNTVSTQAGVIFGTARYISPEGARGEPVTAASDVYSIATLLFECLAGRTPFDGDSSVAILIKQTSEEAPQLNSIARASYVPEPIVRLLTRNLAKDPKRRCQDARELGRALVEAARAGGLKADDLVMRSTLLGEGHSATLMTSMERTRQLEMNPGLAAQLEGKPPPNATQVIDDDGNPVVTETSAAPCPAPATTERESGSRTSDEASLPGPAGDVGTPPPSAPETPADRPAASRPSRVDPTLADEPADDVREHLHRSRAGDSHPDSHSGAMARVGSIPDTDSIPDPTSIPEGEPPPQEPGGGGSRLGIILLCFVAGAALALFVAFRLGVFEAPEPGLESYANRARTALAESAIASPPGENVRDITDAALKRWPGNGTILEIRRDAAHRLAVRAQLVAADDAAEAERLATLALELDPSSRDAQRILKGDGRIPTPDVPDSAATAVPSSSALPPRPPRPPQRPPPSAESTVPDAGETSDEEAVDAGEPTKQGGRWL